MGSGHKLLLPNYVDRSALMFQGQCAVHKRLDQDVKLSRSKELSRSRVTPDQDRCLSGQLLKIGHGSLLSPLL